MSCLCSPVELVCQVSECMQRIPCLPQVSRIMQMGECGACKLCSTLKTRALQSDVGLRRHCLLGVQQRAQGRAQGRAGHDLSSRVAPAKRWCALHTPDSVSSPGTSDICSALLSRAAPGSCQSSCAAVTLSASCTWSFGMQSSHHSLKIDTALDLFNSTDAFEQLPKHKKTINMMPLKTSLPSCSYVATSRTRHAMSLHPGDAYMIVVSGLRVCQVLQERPSCVAKHLPAV